MQALNLVFLPRRKRHSIAVNLLLVNAIVGALALAYYHARLGMEREALVAQHASLNRHRAAPSPAPGKTDEASLEAEFKSAQKIIEKIALPWDQLFNELETSVDEHVVLLGVEPDANKLSVNISAEARNFPAMLRYAKRLGASKSLSGAFIQSHQIQVLDPQRPVRFVISARWKKGEGQGNTLGEIESSFPASTSVRQTP